MKRGSNALSIAEARRIVLRAQGLDRPADATGVTRSRLLRVIGRLGVVQIDSVNALVRSHYLPPYSRLGAYPRALLDDLAYGPKRALFEYWGHEASFIPLPLHPLFRWRMARAERLDGIWGGLRRFITEKRPFADDVFREVERRGPVGAGELEKRNRPGSWWGWTETKAALEYLFWAGRLAIAQRRGFERLYDVPERVIPARIRQLPTPDEPGAIRALVEVAARALGIASAPELRDYFRLPVAESKRAIGDLLEAGELVSVTVEGWRDPAFLTRGAIVPRTASGAALLSPFDSLVWERRRTQRVFGFHYRLEIYTPAHKRVHGYYVLPFLLGDALTARVDLKADRAAGALRVNAVHVEERSRRHAVLSALRPQLAAMQHWLGLERVTGLPRA